MNIKTAEYRLIRRVAVTITVIAFLVTGSLMLSGGCGGGSNDSEEACTGNTSSFPCGSLMLRYTGQGGIDCEQCTSDSRTEEFSFNLRAEILPGGGIGTVINIFDQTLFIEQFEDGRCESMELLTTDAFIPVGTLQDISIVAPDDISFRLELTGQDPESVSCDFCWFDFKPLCAENEEEPCVPFNLDQIGETECVARLMLDSCAPFSCGSEVGHAPAINRNCEFVDCSTLTCEKIEFVANSFITARPGTITDLRTDGSFAISGVINMDRQSAETTCGVPVP